MIRPRLCKKRPASQPPAGRLPPAVRHVACRPVRQFRFRISVGIRPDPSPPIRRFYNPAGAPHPHGVFRIFAQGPRQIPGILTRRHGGYRQPIQRYAYGQDLTISAVNDTLMPVAPVSRTGKSRTPAPVMDAARDRRTAVHPLLPAHRAGPPHRVGFRVVYRVPYASPVPPFAARQNPFLMYGTAGCLRSHPRPLDAFLHLPPPVLPPTPSDT